MAIVSQYPEQVKEIDAMAAKHGRAELSWELVVERIAERMGSKEFAKKAIKDISVDDLLTLLTPEQRRELTKKIEAAKDK